MPFNDQEDTPSTDLKQMDVDFHISTFLVADEYDVPSLRDQVLSRFWRAMMMSWFRPLFFSQINNLCALDLADCRLRELAVKFFVQNARLLFEQSDWAKRSRGEDKSFGKILVVVAEADKLSFC